MAINGINSVQHKWNSNFKFAYLSFIVNGFLCESLHLSTNMGNICLYRSKLKSILFVLSIDIVRIESVDWNLLIEFDISIFVGDYFVRNIFWSRLNFRCLFADFFFIASVCVKQQFFGSEWKAKKRETKREWGQNEIGELRQRVTWSCKSRIKLK